MASVKKRPDSPYWVCCFTLPNGDRSQVSSHTEDKDEAMQKALTYERTSAIAKKQQLDEATARRVLKQIALAAGHDNSEGLTVKAFLEQQIALLKHQHKGRTLERYQYALEHYRDAGGLANQPLHQVRPARAVEWRDALQAEGLSKSTVNHQLSTLRRAFNAAVIKELLDKNPWSGLTLAGSKKSRQRRDAFTFKQFEALLDATAAAAKKRPTTLEHAWEWHRLILLAAYSGQRRNDCVQLTGAQINLDRGVTKFWRGKNKDWFEVPIHPALRPMLADAIERHGKGKLFPALAALPTTGRRSVTDLFRQRVLPLIGIVQPYNTGGTGRKIAALSFHSLRHSLSTWLNDEGVSDVDRMRVVGHKDRDVSQGYTHAGLEHAKRAMEKVPAPRE